MKRYLAAGAALLALSACDAQQFTMSNLAGPGNVAAMDAAVACDFNRALGLAEGAKSSGGSQRLFSHYVQYAVYTETGRSADAARAIDAATNDPETNPGGDTSRQEMVDAGDALLESVRSRREEATGSRACTA